MEWITSAELVDRRTKRDKNEWRLCQKCYEVEWEKQFCKCPACKKFDQKKRMFVHLNEMNPKTIGWNDYDKETDSYPKGVCDGWQLCDACSRKYQVYATW